MWYLWKTAGKDPHPMLAVVVVAAGVRCCWSSSVLLAGGRSSSMLELLLRNKDSLGFWRGSVLLVTKVSYLIGYLLCWGRVVRLWLAAGCGVGCCCRRWLLYIVLVHRHIKVET